MQRQLAERELTIEGPRRQASPGRRKRSVTVNLAESPLSWLHARGHIDGRLFAAGERLRADFELAQLAPKVTMNWDPVKTEGSGQSGLTPSERQIAARQRFHASIGAAGKGLDDILWRVVCAGEAIPDAEKALTWPSRSGKLVLKLALERVADFYGIR